MSADGKYKVFEHPAGMLKRAELCPNYGTGCRAEQRTEPFGTIGDRILGYWCDCDFAKTTNLDGDQIE